MSTLSLAKNGFVSSSKRTKHIKAKYFFVRHFHNTGELDLHYCPTELMWADVLTKPLQGAKFRLMRAFLMNCPIDYHEDTIPATTTSSPSFVPLDNPTDTPSTTRTSPKPFVPSSKPTNNPTKKRSLRPTPSPRGCVETQSPGTEVPIPQRRTSTPTKNVTWRDALFPRRLPTSPPLVSREP